MSSPYLPPEILDDIVDLLQDNPNALKGCCLVSKSWIPRTRKHLFTKVKLITEEHVESWKAMFSDPSTSPAHFARSLGVGRAGAIAAADAEADGWLSDFTHIVHLDVETPDIYLTESEISLIPFHGFSQTIKSLRVKSVDIPLLLIFDFILSSPLLEDLTVSGYRDWVDDSDGSDGPPTFVQPWNPPTLTGSLGLFLMEGTKAVVGRLLSIPGGIHFRKLTLMWHREEDLPSIIALVGGCFHTLEFLDITSCTLDGTSIWHRSPHR